MKELSEIDTLERLLTFLLHYKGYRYARDMADCQEEAHLRHFYQKCMTLILKRAKTQMEALIEENEEDSCEEEEWDDTLNPFLSDNDARDEFTAKLKEFSHDPDEDDEDY